MPIQSDWDERVQEGHKRSQESLKNQIADRYGLEGISDKLNNYVDVGDLPITILSDHSLFLQQARYSFISGQYYPAVAAVCAVGERILNYLIIGLRDSFKHTPEYKNIYRKSSFDNWDHVVDVLDSWDIWLPGVADHFKRLRAIRNTVLHFNQNLESELRELALKAFTTLHDILEIQFPGFRSERWFISDTKGYSFIKKDVEKEPFVKLVYLPKSVLVGPRFQTTLDRGPVDNTEYPDIEISDAEFADLLRSRDY